jgi:hypothetical protein
MLVYYTHGVYKVWMQVKRITIGFYHGANVGVGSTKA